MFIDGSKNGINNGLCLVCRDRNNNNDLAGFYSISNYCLQIISKNQSKAKISYTTCLNLQNIYIINVH